MSAVLSACSASRTTLRGDWVDQVAQVFSVLGFAVPGFIVAVLSRAVLTLGTHWFKPTGYVPITTSSPAG